MKKYKFYYLLLICLVLLSCSKKTEKLSLEETIIQVVSAFKEKDSENLKKFISKEEGVVVISQHGVHLFYQKEQKIEDIKESLFWKHMEFSSNFSVVSFESLPSFSCEEMDWNKYGLFCDTIQRDNTLSSVAEIVKSSEPEYVTDKDIKKFKELEKNSHEVILSDKNGGNLIFHLTQIKGRWYLTVLDYASTDCSA